jgi:uncharacterized membrane protein
VHKVAYNINQLKVIFKTATSTLKDIIMSWIILSIIPAFFWSITNLIDQHLSRRFFINDAVGLQATTGLFTFVSGLLISIFIYGKYDITLMQTLCFLAMGAAYNVAHIPYIKALQLDEAKIVVPLFQLVPVFVFILAWLFLGETISGRQAIAGVFIIVAAIGIMYDFKGWSIKYKTFGLMMLSCFGIAALITINRHIVQETHWLPVSAMLMIGSGLFSASIFAVNRKSLKNTVSLFKDNSYKILVFFVAMELVGRSAMLLFQKALAIAPAAALVQVTLNGTQSFFIFGLTMLFALATPSTIAKIDLNRILAFQLACVAVMSTALYVLLIKA